MTLINSIQKSPSSEANRSLSSQEIPHVLQNPKVTVHAGDKFIELLGLNLFCIISCHLRLLWLLYLILVTTLYSLWTSVFTRSWHQCTRYRTFWKPLRTLLISCQLHLANQVLDLCHVLSLSFWRDISRA